MNDRFKLYVEGRDDLAVSCHLALRCDELCEPHGKDAKKAPKFRVEEYDPNGEEIRGVDALLKRVPTLLAAPSIDRLGIVVDADADPVARWLQIRHALMAAGYPAPPVADLADTIVERAYRARVGVWIWPDNMRIGMIEDFVESMIRDGDSLLPVANRCVDEVRAIDQRFVDRHRQKAVIHTWLAWQKKAGRPLGVAIEEAYFDSTGELASRYVAWMIRLFG